MQQLTDAMVAALPVTGQDQIKTDPREAGFGIRVTPAGTKIFFARTKFKGRRAYVPIGNFPDLKTAEARRLARVILADIRAGRDPRPAQALAPQAEAMTIAELADKWMADYVRPKLKPRTIFDYERLLAQHILPRVGHVTVAGIGRDDVIQLHVAMAKTPRRANYTVSTLRALINFGIDLKLRPPADNPVRRIKFYREGNRERFLTEDEIGKAADAITEAEREGVIGVHAAAGLRFALFTGARSGEVTAITWAHVQWDRRVVRLPDSKGNVPRFINLSEAALEILRTVPRVEPYVVAGVKPGEPYKNLSRAWIVVRAKCGLDDVRLHDLRHSYASLAINKGVSLPIIGKLLGHRASQSTSRYAHLAQTVVAATNDELGAAMQAAIAKQRAPLPNNVTPLPRSRRRGGKR